MSVSLSNSLQISHECPQCSGPVTLSETDRLLSCEFCRVRLYISSKGHFRYYFPPDSRITEDIFFIPYWRVRGLSYRLQSLSVRSKMLDASLLAADTPALPRSLGLRTQALPLRFVSSATAGRFIKPGIPFSRFRPELDAALQALKIYKPGEIINERFIGEAVSLIYTPFYIKGGSVYDGILNRPVPGVPCIDEFKEEASKWDVRFNPALCPECGWDLEGERNSAAMLCRNCDTTWEAKGGEFIRTPYSIIPSAEGGCYIPFWKISASVEGLTLNSYADIAKLANIPKAIREEWETQPACFWAPAFVARPQIFLRLAQQLTTIGPGTTEKDRLPSGELLPVTLGSDEACESIYVTIAQMAVPKNRYFPMMDKVKISTESASLVFIPFNSGNFEYLQPQMNLCIPKNTFRDI